MRRELLIFAIIILLVPISGCLEKNNHEKKVYIVFFDEDMTLMENESENNTGFLHKGHLLNKTYYLNITQLNITKIIVEMINYNVSVFDRYGISTYPYEEQINITLTVTPPKNANITCSPSNPGTVTGPNHFLVDTYVTKLEMNISLGPFPEKREIDEDGYDEAILQETNTDAIGEWRFLFEFYPDVYSSEPSGGGPVIFFLAWDLTLTAHHYHSMMKREA